MRDIPSTTCNAKLLITIILKRIELLLMVEFFKGPTGL